MPFSTDDWQWLGDFLKRRGLPGLAIAVRDGDELVFSHCLGWAELRKRAELARCALETGIVTTRDLGP